MAFPKTDRVIYELNPLHLVLCQLRFPSDLKIEMGMTAGFQDIVGSQFPFADDDTDGSELPIPEEMSDKFPDELLQSLSAAINRRFQFKTADRIWTISLTRNFVALETSKYSNWEEFREYLQLMLSALSQSYRVPFFTRIGLRYVNVIDRDTLQLSECDWHELLADFIVGSLVLEKEGCSIPERKETFLVELENSEDVVRVQHGIFTDTAGTSTRDVYILDNDFYTRDGILTEVGSVITKTNKFNLENRRLFRSCIKSRLHDGMGPQG